MRLGVLSFLIGSMLATAVVSMAVSVSAADLPPLPPSSLELRLQEYEARQALRRQAAQARALSRQRRVTGAGAVAGSDKAAEVLPVQAVTVGRVAFHAVMAAAIVAVAMEAANEDLSKEGASSRGSSVSSPTSTN